MLLNFKQWFARLPKFKLLIFRGYKVEYYRIKCQGRGGRQPGIFKTIFFNTRTEVLLHLFPITEKSSPGTLKACDDIMPDKKAHVLFGEGEDERIKVRFWYYFEK